MSAGRRGLSSDCSAFVFKVQANMDRAHRDRIAFIRVCSGVFERGMVLTCGRTGKPFATKYASQVFGAERTTVDEAFPGDVVGLVNAMDLQIGDTLYVGDPVAFRRFRASPRGLRLGPPNRYRQVQAVQGEDSSNSIAKVSFRCCEIPWRVTRTRFWRRSALCSSMCSRIDWMSSSTLQRRSPRRRTRRFRFTDQASADRLREVGVRILARSDGRLVALFESRYRLQRLEQDEPGLMLEPISVGV